MRMQSAMTDDLHAIRSIPLPAPPSQPLGAKEQMVLELRCLQPQPSGGLRRGASLALGLGDGLPPRRPLQTDSQPLHFCTSAPAGSS